MVHQKHGPCRTMAVVFFQLWVWCPNDDFQGGLVDVTIAHALAIGSNLQDKNDKTWWCRMLYVIHCRLMMVDVVCRLYNAHTQVEPSQISHALRFAAANSNQCSKDSKRTNDLGWCLDSLWILLSGFLPQQVSTFPENCQPTCRRMWSWKWRTSEAPREVDTSHYGRMIHSCTRAHALFCIFYLHTFCVSFGC